MLNSLTNEFSTISDIIPSKIQNEYSTAAAKHPTGLLIVANLVGSISMNAYMLFFVAVNMPEQELKTFCNQSVYFHYGVALDDNGLHTLWGIIVGSPLILSMVGTVHCSYLADRYGRKMTLFFIHSILLVTSAVMCAFSKWAESVELFLVGRLIAGLGYGISINAYSLYSAECSPPEFRGITASISGITGQLITLLTFVCTLPQVFGTAQLWPLTYIPAMLCGLITSFIGIAFLPESPKYTFTHRNNRNSSVNDIRRLYGKTTDVVKTLADFSKEKSQAKKLLSNCPIAYMLQTPHLRMGLIVGLAACFVRGACGAEIMQTYGTYWTVKTFHINYNTAKYINMSMMTCKIPSTLICSFVVDRFNRRPLFLGVSISILFANIIFFIACIVHNVTESTIASIVGITMLFFVSTAFLFGITPIGFILITEVTPQNVRSFASSLALCSFLLCEALQYLIFPILLEHTGPFAIVILIIVPSLIAIAILIKFMPETKGIPVNEVIAKWIVETESIDERSFLLE